MINLWIVKVLKLTGNLNPFYAEVATKNGKIKGGVP
jgi:hypothetical protein